MSCSDVASDSNIDNKIPTSAKKSLTEHEYYKDERYRGAFNKILETHKEYRECLRDGNCLYLSYVIALADLVLTRDEAFLDGLLAGLQGINERLAECKISEASYSQFYETFVEILKLIFSRSETIESISLYLWYECVVYLRLVVSTELKSNQGLYQPYITDMDIGTYCAKFVDAFYKEAGYIELCALSRSIPVSICVVSLTDSTFDLNVYGEAPNQISILYTHNHFEPAYAS
jgi:ubiquitin thioesterase protein OTUB1